MIMKVVAGILLSGAGALFLVGCESPDPEPVLPASEHSDMPWNTPRPGEGSGAFGGVFDQNR